MEDDCSSQLRDMVVDRLDEVVSSPHFTQSSEPMVPILRQICSNLLWMIAGEDKESASSRESISTLRRLMRERSRAACDTERLVAIVGDALLVHISGLPAQIRKELPISTSVPFSSQASPLLRPLPTRVLAPAPSAPFQPGPAPLVGAKKRKANGAYTRSTPSANASASPSSDSGRNIQTLHFHPSPPPSQNGNVVKEEPKNIVRISPTIDQNMEEDFDDGSSDDNPLLRIMRECEQRSTASAMAAAAAALSSTNAFSAASPEGGGDEDDFLMMDAAGGTASTIDIAAILARGDAHLLHGTSLSPSFQDPFCDEPPICSPSISTIRKNTKRSKPEKIAEKGCSRVNRDPNAPRQVISAYLCFVGEMRAKRNNGELDCNGGEFGALLKSEWMKLPDKSRYEMQHEEDKRRYEAELAAWARSECRPVPGRKAYSFFVLEEYDKLRKFHPTISEEDVMLKVYCNWRDLPDKSKYFQLQARDKDRFRSEQKLFYARASANGSTPGAVPTGQVTSKKPLLTSSTSLVKSIENDITAHLEAVTNFVFE